jgi:hypothetical protein
VAAEKAFTFEFLNIVKLIHIKNVHLSLEFLQIFPDHNDRQTLKSYSDNLLMMGFFQRY